MTRTDALAPLRHGPFRFLAGGRVVSMLGNAMAPIALAFAVLSLTGSVADLGLVVGARSLTNVIFLLFGGVVADRLPRQLVMVVSSALAAASQGAVATLVLTHTATIPLLIGLSAVNGTVSAFAFPAAAAIMSQAVPEAIRKQANALNRLAANAAQIVGASAGGLLIAGVGPGWGLAADAGSFAIAGALFALVRVPHYRDPDSQRHNLFHDLREGWVEFRTRTWLWVVVLGFCFFNMAVVGGISVLGPAVANLTFGAKAWGIVLAAETAGMLIGAVVAIRIRVRRLLRLGVICCFGLVVFLGALGLAPRVLVLIPAAFITGIAIEQFGIAWEVSMQEHIPAQMLARVYSYDALGSFIAIPIGQVAAGPLAEALGLRPALLIAAGVVALSVLGMLASRGVRTLEHAPAKAAEEHVPALEVAAGEPSLLP